LRYKLDQSRERKVRIRALVKVYCVASGDHAWFEHSIVPTRSAVPYHRFRHKLVIETQGELEAGLPRLTDLEAAASDTMHITGTQVALLQTFNAEILTEGAQEERSGVLRVFTTPRGIVGQGICVHGFLRASMHREVCLLVTFEA
jgi:hypothetical protein